MSESRNGDLSRYFPPRETDDRPEGASDTSRTTERLSSEARQGNGLEAYRRWLTRVQTPGSRRAPLDVSLYTWKGYRQWSDKVRRDWKAEE